MKKVSVLFISGSLLFFATPSFAEETSEEVSTESSEVVAEPTSDPEPEPTYAPGMSPGEHGAWVPVDANGNAYADVIVCTPEVCAESGPGSFAEIAYGPGTRMVLQALQDPVEAANSPNGVGNVAGYSDAKYNSELQRWEIHEFVDYTSPYRIYEIPLAYPGDEKPFCIENCPEDQVDEEAIQTTDSDQTVASAEENSEEIITTKNNKIFITKVSNEKQTTYLMVRPKVKKNSFFFWYKINGNDVKSIKVIFSSNDRSTEAKFRVNKSGRAKIKANNLMLNSEITILNKGKVIERIILVK